MRRGDKMRKEPSWKVNIVFLEGKRNWLRCCLIGRVRRWILDHWFQHHGVTSDLHKSLTRVGYRRNKNRKRGGGNIELSSSFEVLLQKGTKHKGLGRGGCVIKKAFFGLFCFKMGNNSNLFICW